MVQIHINLPCETLERIDRWILEGKFKGRSNAIATIIDVYQEQERTREYLKMLRTAVKKQENILNP